MFRFSQCARLLLLICGYLSSHTPANTFSIINAASSVNRLQTTGDRLVVFPGHVFQAATYHMDDALLDMGLRIDAVYRIRKVFQAVHTGNQDVLKTTIFQLRQHIQPECCAFIFGQSPTRQRFLAFGVDTQRQEDSSVYDAVMLTDFYDNAAHVNDGIQRIQLPVLPLRSLLF